MGDGRHDDRAVAAAGPDPDSTVADTPEAWRDRGLECARQERFAAAADCFDRYVALAPGAPEAWVCLGIARGKLDHIAGAQACFLRALDLDPNCVEAHINLGLSYVRQGDVREGIACYDRALEIAPERAETHRNRAIALLLLGDLAEGEREYDWRWEVPEWRAAKRPFTQPWWDGSSLAGKSILVWGEQGIGDEILYASLLPEVMACADRVVVECAPRLVPLLARSFPQAEVIARSTPPDPRTRLPDVQCASGSLPRWLRSSLAAFPDRDRYLVADGVRVAAWRSRLASLGDGLKVGIAWSSTNQRKQLPALRDWLPILTLPGATFVSLQAGDTTADLAALGDRASLLHCESAIDPLRDFDEYAALVAALDGVVTVSNSTAHLAGALGLPTWTLVPRIPTNCRWGLSGDRAPWYPTLRLLRQAEEGCWEPEIAAIALQLQAAIADRPACDPLPLHLDAADRLQAAGDLEGAIACCERALALAPTHAETRERWERLQPIQQYVTIAMEAPDADTRRMAALEAVRLAPNYAPARRCLARVLSEAGELAAAERELTAALTLRPHWAAAYLDAATVLYRQGRTVEAISACDRAVALAPDALEAQWLLAQLYDEAGWTDLALPHYQHALLANPDRVAVADLLRVGDLLWQRDRLAEAAPFYQHALRRQPPIATHHAPARDTLAWTYLHAAIPLPPPRDREAIDPAARAAADRALSLAQQGILDLAIPALQEAIRLQPQWGEAHANLGICLAQRGNLDGAFACLRGAVAVDPHNPIPYLQWGKLLARQDKLPEAEACFARAIALDPNGHDAHTSLGIIRGKQEDYPAAAACFQQALHCQPDNPDILCHLGAAYLQLDRQDEAVDCFERALAIAPEFAPARNGLGEVLYARGHLDAAIAQFRAAIARQPTYPEAYANLGLALKHQGNFTEAIFAYRSALALRPDWPEARLRLAIALLLVGQWQEGLAAWESRWQPRDRRPFVQPLWDGSPLAGKAMLLWGEQGIGEQVLFASLVPEVAAIAARCVVECDPRLVPLLARSFPGMEVVPRANPPQIPDPQRFDLQSPLGSLVRWLRPTPASVREKARAPYLIADPDRVAALRDRYAKLPGLKVGISWYSPNKIKRLPDLSAWYPILGVEGIACVSLQHGDRTADIARVSDALGIAIHADPDIDPLTDLDGFAAQVAAMDWVVTVSNSTAHIAGALGVPTWLLLSEVPPLWYWFGEGEEVAWYPTMRCFRQGFAGDGNDAIARAAETLRQLAAST